MFSGILDKIRGRGAPTTITDLTEALTEGLALPSVYKPEVVHKSSGRAVSGQKHVDLQDMDLDALATPGDLKREIERLYEDDDLSVRITSPTDKDGISERIHFKTLRDAAAG